MTGFFAWRILIYFSWVTARLSCTVPSHCGYLHLLSGCRWLAFYFHAANHTIKAGQVSCAWHPESMIDLAYLLTRQQQYCNANKLCLEITQRSEKYASTSEFVLLIRASFFYAVLCALERKIADTEENVKYCLKTSKQMLWETVCIISRPDFQNRNIILLMVWIQYNSYKYSSKHLNTFHKRYVSSVKNVLKKEYSHLLTTCHIQIIVWISLVSLSAMNKKTHF